MSRIRIGLAGVILAGAAAAVGLAPRGEVARAEGAATWKIDSVHSSLMFRVLHLNTAYFYGRFNEISGEISWDDGAPASGSLNVEIKTESVDSKNPGRDRHLRSSDFFNADQFPTCTFKSTSITARGEQTFELKGDLTINGVTKPVAVTLEKTGTGKDRRGTELIGFETVFTVKRSDFGITFMSNGLGDEVKVFCSLEAGKQ